MCFHGFNLCFSTRRRCLLRSWFIMFCPVSLVVCSVLSLAFLCITSISASFCIWWAHNDYRFCRVPPSALIVMDRVKARLRFHLPLFFRRFSSGRRPRFIFRQWGARSYIASIVDGRTFRAPYLISSFIPALSAGVVQSLMKRMGTVQRWINQILS